MFDLPDELKERIKKYCKLVEQELHTEWDLESDLLWDEINTELTKLVKPNSINTWNTNLSGSLDIEISF